MTRVLLIEPTGAVTINPNLMAMVRCLCDNHFHVDIISVKRDYPQEWIHPTSRLMLCPRNGTFEANFQAYEALRDDYDLIIGVDRGIVAAASIARRLEVPVAFISYEILFTDEIGAAEKAIDVDACRGVSFAVAQDTTRAYLVSREYGIPLEKILCIPVAEERGRSIERTDYLRIHFKIPQSKRIAIFSGAVTARSMIDDLVRSAKDWEDWVLIVHSHSPMSKQTIERLKRSGGTSNLYFSDLRLNTFDELSAVIASADAGIALFAPNFDSPYERKNVLFLGLASGKISTYLKNAVPVIVNEIGEMSELVRQHGLGIVVDSAAGWNPASHAVLTDPDTRARCREFFETSLSFDVFESQFIEAVRDSLAHPSHSRRYNTIEPATLNNHISNINRLTRWFNFGYKAVHSKYYAVGESVLRLRGLLSWALVLIKPSVRRFLGRNTDPITSFNDGLIAFYSTARSRVATASVSASLNAGRRAPNGP